VVDKELENYRKQALDLWFNGGSCTGQSPAEHQDSQNEDDEFHRLEEEQKRREEQQTKTLNDWALVIELVVD
jgi:hypothetical protein